MSLESNKSLVRRLYDEAVNGKDMAVLDQIMVSDVVSHTPFPEGKTGVDGFKEVFGEVIGAFPDYRVSVEDQIAEDELVVTRYTARGSHQGEQIELTGIDIDRVVDGQIVEHWSEASVPPLMATLAAEPPR